MGKFRMLANFFVTAGSSIKSWIFADGKFQKTRAIILLAGFAMISASMYFFGAENTKEAIELLDQFSDIVGYAE